MTFFGAYNKKNHRMEIINTDDYLKGFGYFFSIDPCFLDRDYFLLRSDPSERYLPQTDKKEAA